jgi:hypothetical protein
MSVKGWRLPGCVGGDDVGSVIWGSLAACILAATIVGLRRNALRLTRTIGAPPAAPAATFRGGFWSRVTGGTRGYWARLEFFDWGIRLRGSKPGGFLLPVYEIRYDELTDVRLVATRLRHGVRFCSDALPAPVNFETCPDAIPRIVAQLQGQNVPVMQRAGHMGWLPGD